MATQAQHQDLVEVRDELTEAFAAGREHAASVYASGRNTLVDRLSLDEWANWNGVDEMALVSDPDGLDLPDHFGCDDLAA